MPPRRDPPPAVDDPDRLKDLWLPLGPATMLGGQGDGLAHVSGRVREVEVSPDGTRVYVATANGGVWYSSDQGSTWMPIGGWAVSPSAIDVDYYANILVCGTISVDWDTVGENDTVYVGTGEITPRRQGYPGGSMGGIGVLRAEKPAIAARDDQYAQVWTREGDGMTGLGIYRLAFNPNNKNQLAAATSNGLWIRTPGGAGDPWKKVTATPFDKDRVVSDAIWTSNQLFVALINGNVFTSANGTDGFSEIVLPDRVDGRLSMAASADGATIYVLGKGPRLWRITGANVQRIANVPALLFGGDEGRTETGVPGGARAQPLDTNEPTSNQSHYDMAIAVHPDHADQLVLGGAAIETSNAALFKCTVGGPANAPRLDYNPANDPKPATPDGTAGSDLTFIGRGVHADVHGVTFAKRGDVVDVWVACDGGVYRSTTGGGNYTWQTRNNGLAVIEPGYLACHPLNESVIVVGTQDNGVLRRTGDTAWMWELAGDGGGVAFHPKQTHRYMAQSTAAGWRDNAPVNGMKEPILRNWPWLKAQKDENNKANFYSSPGVVAATNTEGARIAIGTNRVWVSENFGKFWVTLTSQSDPQLPQVGNTDRDVKYDDYRDRVLACRWLNENDLFVLCDRSIQRFVRTPGGPATWDRTVVTDHKNKCSAYTESDIDGTRMDYLPPLGDWADVAFKPGAADVATTLYVACVGHNSAPKMDTLWWFDGNKTWYATGLRFGVKAPALAVAVHPTDPTTVFVGTTIGVYQGKFQPDVGGGVPAWQFFEFSKGLPEAAVQDLAFFYDPAEPLLLLRAALQSRGVWEVDLLGPCDEKTYLRAHGYDSRRRAQTSLVDPSGPSTFGPLDQFASPDILVRPRPPADAASTPGPPAILPIDASHHSRSGSLWTFQTAFRAVEPRCRPTGRWSKAFESQLVAYKKKPENALGAAPVIDAATWTNVVTQARVWQQPWDGPAPTEADFLQLVMDDDDETPPVQFSQRHLAVHVMAHQRGLQPLKIIEVLVVLLIRRMVEGEALWPGLSIDDAWKTQTVAALTGGIIPADGHWPSGDWAAANPATPTRNLAAPIDAMHPQVATFDVNFPDTVTDEQYLLLAVCSSETATITNARLPGATLGELIVRSPHVAAHRLHILT